MYILYAISNSLFVLFRLKINCMMELQFMFILEPSTVMSSSYNAGDGGGGMAEWFYLW
jgi:hypothetical protein